MDGEPTSVLRPSGLDRSALMEDGHGDGEANKDGHGDGTHACLAPGPWRSSATRSRPVLEPSVIVMVSSADLDPDFHFSFCSKNVFASGSLSLPPANILFLLAAVLACRL